MSSKDVRNTYVVELLPQLIKAVTGLKVGNHILQTIKLALNLQCVMFQESDERSVRILNNAMTKMQSFHYLSVNSHELQRRVESVGERFVVANMSSYAQQLVEMCDKLKEDPLCKEHYESDIQWSLLSFMLDVARKPEIRFGAYQNKMGLNYPVNEVNEPERNEPKIPNDIPKKRPILDSTDDLSVSSSIIFII